MPNEMHSVKRREFFLDESPHEGSHLLTNAGCLLCHLEVTQDGRHGQFTPVNQNHVQVLGQLHVSWNPIREIMECKREQSKTIREFQKKDSQFFMSCGNGFSEELVKPWQRILTIASLYQKPSTFGRFSLEVNNSIPLAPVFLQQAKQKSIVNSWGFYMKRDRIRQENLVN